MRHSGRLSRGQYFKGETGSIFETEIMHCRNRFIEFGSPLLITVPPLLQRPDKSLNRENSVTARRFF